MEGDPLQHVTRFQGKLPVVLTGLVKANEGHGRRPRCRPPPRPYLLRTSLVRMGTRRLKVDLAE